MAARPGEGIDRLLRPARAALDTGRRLNRAVRADGLRFGVAERRVAGISAGAAGVDEEISARLPG